MVGNPTKKWEARKVQGNSIGFCEIILAYIIWPDGMGFDVKDAEVARMIPSPLPPFVYWGCPAGT